MAVFGPELTPNHRKRHFKSEKPFINDIYKNKPSNQLEENQDDQSTL